MCAAVEVAGAEVDVAEGLVVGDQARTESRLLRRREAEEELGVVGDQVRARDARRHRHLLWQALLALTLEAAAREAAPDARHGEERQVVEECLASVVDVRAAVAAQEYCYIVVLENRVARIAREAPRRQQ